MTNPTTNPRKFETNNPGNHVPVAVMVSESDGHLYNTHCLQSKDVTEVYEFLKGNMTTAGFSFQYAVNAAGEVYEIMKTGKPGKRELTRIIADLEIVEWHYSWCWAAHYFKISENGKIVKTKEIDLTPAKTLKTAISYKGLLY